MRTTTGRALSLLMCSVLLAGCGDDEPPPAAPTGSSTSADPSPSEPEQTGPEPAAGPEVELGSLTLSFPVGYEPRETEDLGAELVVGTGSDGERVALGAFEDFSRESLDEAVELAITTGLWTRRPKRLDDREVDGVPMYHLSGPTGGGSTIEQFGAEFGGYDMTFLVSSEGSDADRQLLIDSVLATATWK